MDIRQLTYFIQVGTDGTYSEAARTLFVSQSALSKSVKALEVELGSKLLVQSDGGLHLTDVGQVLYDKGRRLVAEHNALLDEIKELGQFYQGKLRLGVPFNLGQAPLYRIFSAFAHAYPDVELVISGHGSAHIREKVLTGQLDMGITLVPPAIDSGLHATVMGQTQFGLLVPTNHPLSGETSVSHIQLKDEGFVILNDDYLITRLFKENCHAAGFTPHIKMVAHRSDFIADLVADQQGISIIILDYDRIALRDDLKVIQLNDGITTFDFALITKENGYHATASKHFTHFMKKSWENTIVERRNQQEHMT